MTDDFLAALQSGLCRNGGYQDGVVVDLRPVAHKTLYLIGDIHAKTPRIADLFAHADLYSQLEGERAVVVFLGDLFHREEPDRAGEMESSLETLLTIMELKRRFPRSLYVLLGNHEFTRTERCKHGYFQGALFRKALERRGLGEFYERFIEASPLVVVHPRCVATHAAPARCLKTFDELKQLPVRDAEARQLHRGQAAAPGGD